MGWQRALVLGQIAGAVIASAVALVGLFIVPDNASIPIHAGFRGFDSFVPRTRGLVTLTLIPLLVCGALVLGYWVRQDSSTNRSIVAIIGFASMLVMVVFNIQAVRHGMQFDP